MRYGSDYYFLMDFNLLDIASKHYIILLHNNGKWLEDFILNIMPNAIGLGIAAKYFAFGYDYDVDENYMYFWDLPSDQVEENQELKEGGTINDEIEVQVEGEKYKIPFNLWLSGKESEGEEEIDIDVIYAESSVYCGYCANMINDLVVIKFKLKYTINLDAFL